MTRHATLYDLIVEFHVRAGTKDALTNVGQRNSAQVVIDAGLERLPLIESGNPNVVHVKGEAVKGMGRVINYGLRSNTIDLFNDSILYFEVVK